MKRIFSIIMVLAIAFSLTACEGENALNKRYTKDRSDMMGDLPITENEYNMQVIQEMTPITSSIHTLNKQAQALKMGATTKDKEIERVDDICADIQSAKEHLLDLSVTSEMEEKREALMEALDELEINLASYKTILSSEEKQATKDDIQAAVDIIMSSLETVKSKAD